MKIQALIITIILALSTNLVAQHHGGKQQGPPPVPNAQEIEKMVADLSKELSLSSEQETKILKIYTEHFDEVRIKTAGNTRPDRNEMQILKAKFEKNIRAELTSEQQKKYDAYLKKQNNSRPRR